MEQLKHITIVVASLNRPYHALRTLKYWSKLKIKTHLVDGSEKPIIDSELKNLHQNVKYHHIKTFSEIDRINNILNLINTKYCILSSDDDLLLPNALVDCINKLEDNPDFTSCFGQVIAFENNKEKTKFNRAYNGLNDYSILSNDKNIRLKKNMINYLPSIILSVMRTDIFKLIFEPKNFSKIRYHAALELRASLIASYYGKSICLSNLILLRNQSTSGARRLTSENSSIFRFWFSSSKKEEKNYFLNFLADSIKENENKNEVKKIFKKAMYFYLLNIIIRFFKKKIIYLIICNIPYLWKKHQEKKEKNFFFLDSMVDICKKNNIYLDNNDFHIIKNEVSKM